MNTRDLLFSVPVEAVSFSDTLVEVSKVKAGTNVTMGVEWDQVMAIGGAFVGRNPETRAFLLLVDQKALVETHNQSKTNKLPLQRRGMEIMFSAEALEDGKTIEFYLDEIGTRYADDDVMYVMTSPSHIPVKLSTVKVLL